MTETNTVQRSWIVAAGVAFAVLVIDQLTKSWAESNVRDEPIHLIGSLKLSLTYNRGVAFGLGEGVAPILVLIAIVGLVLVMLGKRFQLGGPSVVALGLVLGGALGNASDRVFRNTGGAVVDFIDLVDWWPVFNIADASIVVGAIVLVLLGSRKPVPE